jgi:hypothetical protein
MGPTAKRRTLQIPLFALVNRKLETPSWIKQEHECHQMTEMEASHSQSCDTMQKHTKKNVSLYHGHGSIELALLWFPYQSDRTDCGKCDTAKLKMAWMFIHPNQLMLQAVQHSQAVLAVCRTFNVCRAGKVFR